MKDATDFFVKYGDIHKPRLRGAFKKFMEEVDIVDGTGRVGVREPMREKFELYIDKNVDNWDEFKEEHLTDEQLEDMMWGFLKDDEEYRQNFFDVYVTGDHDIEVNDPNSYGRLKDYFDESSGDIGITYNPDAVKEVMFLCANFAKSIPARTEEPDADEFVRYWADEWLDVQFGVGVSAISYEGSYSDVDEKCVPIAREFFLENDEFRELLIDKWEYKQELEVDEGDKEEQDPFAKWEYSAEQAEEEKDSGEESGGTNTDTGGSTKDGTKKEDKKGLAKFTGEETNGSTDTNESDDGDGKSEDKKTPQDLDDWGDSEGTVETTIDRSERSTTTQYDVSGDAKPEDAYEVEKEDIVGEQFARNMDSIFPYIGGKTQLADWIIDSMPEHDCYVEVFGGSAAVLLNKPRSTVEVYNDLNDDLVHFFKILRDKPDELREWCSHMVYSRAWYEEIAEDFFNGVRVDNDVERAGRFFYLINSTFGGKLSSKGWRKSETAGSESKAWENNLDRLDYFHERFKGVDIECKSYEEIFDLYDDEGVLFYLDPPYKGTESVYDDSSGFSHKKLAHKLMNLDGEFMLSYDHMPEWADDYYVERRAYKHAVNSVEKDVYEYLVMSTEESGFLQPQETIGDFG